MDKSSKEIKKAGLKVTQPRSLIFEILQQNKDNHLSADEIHQHLQQEGHDVGLATVYRVLSQFESASLVSKLHLEADRAVYELVDEVHHDHMVCTACGKVVEFVDETIESRQQSIADKHGFTLQDHTLVLYGICKDCN